MHRYIKDAALKAALPSGSFLAANSKPEYIHGVFVRRMNSTFPAKAFIPFNDGLFKLAGLPYNASGAVTRTGSVFSSWQEENADWKKIGSK